MLFFVYSYLHGVYLDYGGAPFIRFSRPLSARRIKNVNNSTKETVV